MGKPLLTFVRLLLPPSSGLEHLQDAGNDLPIYTISYARRQIFITNAYIRNVTAHFYFVEVKQ
jgi:hypothetical protein